MSSLWVCCCYSERRDLKGGAGLELTMELRVTLELLVLWITGVYLSTGFHTVLETESRAL